MVQSPTSSAANPTVTGEDLPAGYSYFERQVVIYPAARRCYSWVNIERHGIRPMLSISTEYLYSSPNSTGSGAENLSLNSALIAIAMVLAMAAAAFTCFQVLCGASPQSALAVEGRLSESTTTSIAVLMSISLISAGFRVSSTACISAAIPLTSGAGERCAGTQCIPSLTTGTQNVDIPTFRQRLSLRHHSWKNRRGRRD